MQASINLKKGRVVKRLVIRGRQLFEVSVYESNSAAELQYGLRKSTLKDKGYTKFSMVQVTNSKVEIIKPKVREVKVLGRRILLK